MAMKIDSAVHSPLVSGKAVGSMPVEVVLLPVEGCPIPVVDPAVVVPGVPEEHHKNRPFAGYNRDSAAGVVPDHFAPASVLRSYHKTYRRDLERRRN